MKAELRPRIYLALCLIALTLEGLYIFLNRPLSCLKCKSALVEPSHELPGEFCQPCVEQLRTILTPVPVVYDPPYPVDPQDPVVVIETTRGKVEVELFAQKTPSSTENFLRYVRAHHYDGVIFHRIEDYLCVTGRYRGGYAGAPLDTIPQGAPIKSESGRGFDNKVGTLALPRQDNDAHSATSDFFFNLRDAPHYNRSGPAAKEAGYAVFGQVLSGYDVLDRMRYLPVTDKPIGPGWERMPREAIVIRRAYEKLPSVVIGTVATIDTRSGQPRIGDK